MSKGERMARAHLPSANTTLVNDITMVVGRFRYRFELWGDAVGNPYWKRARPQKLAEAA